MLLSQLIGRRTKEKPAEAALVSHIFLLRGGYMRQVSNGLYSLLPLGVRVLKKIKQIIREEMDGIGGQEVFLPFVNPRELWDESGRYESVGAELVRFKDRSGHEMLLAMTHEETVVALARNETDSYKSYPFMLYQLQAKFRDEPRSRGGLIRVREFTMKDAYSFHEDSESLEEYYDISARAYERIFSRCGLTEVRRVQSDTGMMGGQIAHEYQLLVDSGEDTIILCPACGYIANREVARSVRDYAEEKTLALEKVHTPQKTTIEEVSAFLGVETKKTAKVVFYEKDAAGLPVMVLIRGDLEVNELKLAKFLGCLPEAARPETVAKTGAVAGYASAIGLKGCRVIADFSIAGSANLVCGANERDYHLRNFNLYRDVREYEIADIAYAVEGEGCPECGKPLDFRRGIELGNIFQLGTRYTEKMGMRFIDAEGKEQIPLMGCYGIGVERLLAGVIEERHDKFGPLWPASIAPFQVHIITIDLSEEQQKEFSRPVYEDLLSKGIEVIYDDRPDRPGAKFADADLIGAPLCLIFSSKNFGEKKVEWKIRDKTGKGLIEFSEVQWLVREKVGK
ncbi:MAG: proline--tRNA ligase [Spirochaetales bacterium]|nr:proline--tRNA ligase [Spirochaetales bacterium]